MLGNASDAIENGKTQACRSSGVTIRSNRRHPMGSSLFPQPYRGLTGIALARVRVNGAVMNRGGGQHLDQEAVRILGPGEMVELFTDALT